MPYIQTFNTIQIQIQVQFGRFDSTKTVVDRPTQLISILTDKQRQRKNSDSFELIDNDI